MTFARKVIERKISLWNILVHDSVSFVFISSVLSLILLLCTRFDKYIQHTRRGPITLQSNTENKQEAHSDCGC